MGKIVDVLNSILPIPVLKLTGINGMIELTIEEVFGFPHETSYGGGYGARGILSIQSFGYSIRDEHYFTTGELYDFYIKLEEYFNSLSGEAVLSNAERELELICSFDKLGHVKIKGKFQANPDIENILIFEIASDQTQVRETLNLLRKVSDIFGGMAGIKNII